MKYTTLLIFFFLLTLAAPAQQLFADHLNDRYDHAFTTGEKITVQVKGYGKPYKGQLIEVQTDRITVTNRYRIERTRGMTADQAWKTDTLVVNLREIVKIGWVNPAAGTNNKKMQRTGAILLVAGGGLIVAGLTMLSNNNSTGNFLLIGGLLGTVSGAAILGTNSKSSSERPVVKAVGKSMKLVVK